MKRNSMTVPPAPRSFEELKLERSGASNTSNGNSNNNNNADGATSPKIDASSPWSNTTGSGVGGGDSAREVAEPTIQRGPTTTTASGSGAERHRYDAEEDVTESAPRSLGTNADASPSSLAAGHEPHRGSNAHGIDLSKSPATAALAAGARAAGAAQPFFFSLKLPPPSITHVGGTAGSAARPAQPQVTRSFDNSMCNSPTTAPSAVTSTTVGERRERPAMYGRSASASSPHKEETAAGTTPRIPGAAAPAAVVGGDRKGSTDFDAQQQQSPNLFPRDVGPLPASQARARNRLPSGTHIRRRPRSVARRYTNGSGVNASLAFSLMDSTENMNYTPGTGEYGSPTLTAADSGTTAAAGGGGGRSAFAGTPSIRPQRGSAATATSGRGVGGGGRGVGTGRTREVLPPGTRSGGGATSMPHRRRADPSPAPSRPPRARKGGVAVARAPNATPGSPTLAATPIPVDPTASTSSPTQVALTRSHQNSSPPNLGEGNAVVVAMASANANSTSQQHPVWSTPNSPGASSPLSSSIDTRYILANDKDPAAAAVSATASMGNNNNNNIHLSGSSTVVTSSAGGVAGVVAGAAKPLSGRVIGGSAARTHTPRTSMASFRGVEDATPLRQDYSKLAEQYVQLCTAVGELPNPEWVSGLQAAESDTSPQQTNQHHHHHHQPATHQPPGEALTVEQLSCSGFRVTTSSEVKDLIATMVSSSHENSLNATTTTAPPPSQEQQSSQQQQTLTPRGGARQRGSGLSTAVTPRARTPVASRAKSPRGGAVPASGSTAAKRSGSVGRITAVNRASILGSSQTHGSGAVHTPRTRGVGGGGATSGRTGALPLPPPSSTAAAAAVAVLSSSPRDTVADQLAQRVSRYCSEHLQPYVDNMKHIQQQRQVLDETLHAFVSVAASVIAPSSSSNAANNNANTAASSSTVTEAMCKSLTPLPAHLTNTNTSSASHSHRGPLGNGKDAPVASSPVLSSLATTPRKSSTSRTSLTSSLPNTASTAAAVATIMNRRVATAASVKAASLTDALQGVQGAVVALLSSLADGAKLAHLPLSNPPTSTHEDELGSIASQSFGKSDGFPQSYSSFAPLGPATPHGTAAVGGASSSTTNLVSGVAPADRSQTLAQLISPPSSTPIAAASDKDSPPLALCGASTSTGASSSSSSVTRAAAVPYLPLSSAIGSSRVGDDAMPSPLSLTGNSNVKSQCTYESGRNGTGVSATICPPPLRFLDFVETQERAIAAQLSHVCAAVRTALGAPAPLVETGSASVTTAENAAKTTGTGVEEAHGTSMPAAASATTGVAGSASVQLEQADMLDNPFFVPNKYLQSLAAMLTHADDEAADAQTPKLPAHADIGAVRAGVKTSSTVTSAKSGKATAKKLKAAKSSGGLGSNTSGVDVAGGGLTGRSSTESTPRIYPSMNAFTPLFTVRLPADDATAADHDNNSGNVNATAHGEPHRRSLSSSSTENTATTMAVAADSSSSGGGGHAETFVLHCIKPTTAAGVTPRPGNECDFASGRQASAQFTVTDPGATSSAAGGATPLLSATTSGKSAANATGSGGGGWGSSSNSSKATKRATSASAGKRGGGAGQRSKSSGGSTRVGTASRGGGGGGPPPPEPPRTALVAPWLTSQGGRGNVSASSPSGKKPRKKTASANLYSTLNNSTGGVLSTSTAAVAASAHSHGHYASSTRQMESQRQLAMAWKLWNLLECRFLSSRKASGATQPRTPDIIGTAHGSVVMGEKDGRTEEVEEEATQQFLPRLSSPPQNDTLSTSPRVPVGGTVTAATTTSADATASTNDPLQLNAVTSHPTPPTAEASTAAATPARAVVVEVRKVTSPVSRVLSSWSSNNAVGPLESPGSPDQHLEGTVAPSRTAIFAEPPVQEGGGEGDDDEEEEENTAFSSTTARVAENMASLSNVLRVPRRLEMEETVVRAQNSLPTESASKQSSQTTAPHALSMTPQQHAALTSASALSSDEVLVSSGAVSKRVTEKEREAGHNIVDWWLRVREQHRCATQLRATHAAANARQRQKVLEARVHSFLVWCVCRLRLQRRIRAREVQQNANAEEAVVAQRAREASDSYETRSNNSGTPRSVTSGSAKKSAKSANSPSHSTRSPTVAPTSREKFLRSKEQRKAMAAGPAAAAASSSPVSAGSPTAKDGVAPPRITPLPLAASGISTFAMGEYDADGNFTVSAMHRLLHAPPSLLYATCTAALHYPTHPPMAYVDNSSPVRSNGAEGEERQQSEVPPDPDTRFGDGVGGHCANNKNNNSSQRRGPPGRNTGTTETHKNSWHSKGICFVSFRELRRQLCCAYEARIPPRTAPAAMDCAVRAASAAKDAMSPLDNTLNSFTTSYRGGSRQQMGAAMLLIPATLRYESVVDANELHHHTPVTKAFHRPFEQWGMAYNLTSRIFCAAAIYAWQLIFSHTPFDDAKQRELPTREDQQARLERVAERNDIILDCYGVRSEREWMREATKDLSFVGQIFVPNYPGDDPAQEKECIDNYDFVKNFLFQCFPNINKLADIPDFLVGAGIFFVLKEVFHVSRDSPLTRRLKKYVPRVLVKSGEDYLRAVTPATSPLYAGADGVGSDSDDDDKDFVDGLPPVSRPIAAPTSLATPRATDYGKGGNGLSGLQRSALHRYEQLRQLYHLSYGMLDEEERAACAWSGMQPSPQSHTTSKPCSPSRMVQSASLTGKDRSRLLAGSSTTEDKLTLTGTGSSICTNASDDCTVATSPMRRYMAHSGAGPVTPLRATPTTAALSVAFNTPAAMREGPRRGSTTSAVSTTNTAVTKRAVPPHESDIQLAHIPHCLLRPSAADAQFVRDFEEEVSKSMRRILDNVAGGGGSDPSFNSAEVPAALAAGIDVHDALDIAYPDHFLVKLSEMLAFELFGLQVSLGSCEDLDSTFS
jgi:hypothetical protein